MAEKLIVGVTKNGIPILATRDQIKAKAKDQPSPEPRAPRKRRLRVRTWYLKEKMDRAVPGSANDPCVYCGGVAENVDHIVARSKGGNVRLLYNLAPSCRKCNQAKGDQNVLMFLLDKP